MRWIAAIVALLFAPACAGGPELAQGWERDATFYTLFVRSFADSTTGPLAGDGIGDIRGIIERLDYLNDGDPETTDDLGVTGLWLLPVTQSPSYHGYDTTDYRAIDDEYGTAEDFAELLDACHARGVRVLIDLVVNHTADEHPWFLESIDAASERRTWYRWESTRPDQPGPWGQPVWHGAPGGDDAGFFYGCFFRGMPDLNYRNPDVTAEMFDIARFWLEDVGVDGFRLDAVKYLVEDGAEQENTRETLEWLRGFSEHAATVKPGAFIVAEVWDRPGVIARYIDEEPPAVASVFDFPLAYAIVEGLRDGDAGRIRDVMARSWSLHAGRANPFLTNHDMDRATRVWGRDPRRAKAAATLLLTAPGSPFIFYGEEIGQDGGGRHEDLRTPLQWTADRVTAGFTTGVPWQAPKPDMASVSVEAQRDDADSLLTHYRALIAVRNGQAALRRGGFEAVATTDPRIIAYVRTLETGDGTERVLVMVNATDRPVSDCRVDAGALGVEPGQEGSSLLDDRPVPGVLGRHPEMWRPAPVIRPFGSVVIRLGG